MLTVRRLPDMASDLEACKRYLNRIIGPAVRLDSHIVRNALICYRETLRRDGIRAGKIKE